MMITIRAGPSMGCEGATSVNLHSNLFWTSSFTVFLERKFICTDQSTSGLSLRIFVSIFHYGVTSRINNTLLLLCPRTKFNEFSFLPSARAPQPPMSEALDRYFE
jgi:hypothetical protein